MRSRLLVAAALVGLLVALPHCSSSYADYCEKTKDCEGGNDKDIDACVEAVRALENVADAYDCGDAFEKAFDCLESKSVCKEGRLDSSGCKAEGEALEACQEAASGKK